jgi:hypothetical protein
MPIKADSGPVSNPPSSVVGVAVGVGVGASGPVSSPPSALTGVANAAKISVRARAAVVNTFFIGISWFESY